MAEIELVDLEVIARYSLAIRQESAPAEEVLAVLDESRAFVLAILDGASLEEADRRARAVAEGLVEDEDVEDRDGEDDGSEPDDPETEELEPEPVPLPAAEAASRRAARRARREGRARA